MPGPYSPAAYSSDVSPAAAGFPGLEAMHTNVREWFSWSVVASVASAAGLVCQPPNIDANKTDVWSSPGFVDI